MKNIFERLKNDGFGIHHFFAALAAAFELISCAALFMMPGDFNDYKVVLGMSLPVFLLSVAAAFVIIALSALFLRRADIISWSLIISTVAFASVLAAKKGGDVYFALGLAAVILIVVKYLSDNDKLSFSKMKLTYRSSFFITLCVFIVLAAATAYITAFRYRTFYSATYDFGIFAQMFEQMAKTGQPLTTVERDGLVSHFAVHFSPVFYFFLPGYMIFRSPFYLHAIQAIAVVFGMFPVRRIAKTLGASPLVCTAAALIYAFFPTMINGCFYDFHENKFVSVFILYLIYFILREANSEKSKYAFLKEKYMLRLPSELIPIIVFALLTMSVKEDAAIYVIAVAVWIIFTRRDKLCGGVLLFLALAWFALATTVMTSLGGEVMMSRYSNFALTENSGVFDIIKISVLNIGYTVGQTVTTDRLVFILWIFVPLLFTPFMTKKSSVMFLLVPMLFINMISSWQYQYNVDFQYTYGTVALAIAAAAVAVSEMKRETRRFIITASLAVSIVFTVSLVYPKIVFYAGGYINSADEYKEAEALLDRIPDDASVTASAFLAPHLYYIDELHTEPKYYGEAEKTDFYVIDVRYHGKDADDPYVFMGDDYMLVGKAQFVEVYQRIGGYE